MENPGTFGELLARTRKSKGVFAVDLARFLGVSTNYLAHVEHSRRYPFDPEKVQRIASFLGVKAEPLLSAAIETRNRTQRSLRRGYALVVSRGEARLNFDLRP
jgi:transcriptional regulator with XRE-family HTH domain